MATIFREFSQIRFITKFYDILKKSICNMPICFAHKLTFYMIKSRVNLFYRENRIIEISLAKLFFAFVVMK